MSKYHCFVKDKSKPTYRYGGVHGLCMIVKEEISKHARQINETQYLYVLWVKFENEAFGFECIIGSVYLPGEILRRKHNEMYRTIANDI